MAASNGRSPNRKRPAPAPLPINLPVPEELVDQEPQHLTLSAKSNGELTPAQRARLGLDINPAEPEPQPAEPQQPVPAARPQPVAQAPPLAAAAEPVPAAAQAEPTDFDFRAMEAEPEPEVAPLVEATETFAPIAEQPRLAPVRQHTGAGDRAPAEHAPETRRKTNAERRAEHLETFEDVKHDRNILTYGVAWTAFSIAVTAVIGFTANMGGDPAAAAGPGPMIPGIASIVMGWVVVVASRPLGRYWGVMMLIPALVLIAGPYVYKNFWAGSVEDAAHSYLSVRGTNSSIDVDATSVVSETVNTERGCFSINRVRSSNDTEVAVVTYVAETARQQADYALAPRYAGRIEAGGERAVNRVFTFKGGRAPAIVSTPGVAPLDCKNSVSAPGSRAGTTPRDADESAPLAD
ncbi:MAG: hypothetical protein WAP35_10255 [Solirubrobacterales bacterium]